MKITVLKGKNKEGWTTGTKGERPLRKSKYGLTGQTIWHLLQEMGFVHKGAHFQKEKNEPLTDWEDKLKNWLIWGYWEKTR